MSKKEERAKQLLRIIEKQNSTTIHDLAQICNVSEITIRRDLQGLEAQELVENIRGIVFFRGNSENESYLLSVANSRHIKEKRAIGSYAAKMIQPGELVIIDNGSTTEQLAAQIPYTLKATILCYNINVLNNLFQKPNISLTFCGGNFHPQTLMFECPESLEIIRRTRATKVFVSAAGIHETLGVTCVSDYELTSKREIIKAGVERILLVDSSKFGVVQPCFVGELTDFETIVTDRGLPDEWIRRIQEKGIKLIIV